MFHAELLAKGADIDALRALALAGAPELQQQLKKLGYAKLGERAIRPEPLRVAAVAGQ